MDVLDLQFGRSIIPFSQVGILTYKFLALNKINFNLIYFFIISILFTRRIDCMEMIFVIDFFLSYFYIIFQLETHVAFPAGFMISGESFVGVEM